MGMIPGTFIVVEDVPVKPADTTDSAVTEQVDLIEQSRLWLQKLQQFLQSLYSQGEDNS
jgi:hypothetical protein